MTILDKISSEIVTLPSQPNKFISKLFFPERIFGRSEAVRKRSDDPPVGQRKPTEPLGRFPGGGDGCERRCSRLEIQIALPGRGIEPWTVLCCFEFKR